MSTTVDALTGRIVACLEWATSVVRSANANPAQWKPDDDEAIRPFEKMLTEAALLALISQRALGDHLAIKDLLESVVECSGALDRIYELIRWHPYLWTSAGAIWVILDELAVGDTVKRERLRRLWKDKDPIQPRERVPYRLLDQAWIRSIVHRHQDFLLCSHDLLSCSSFENVAGGLFMGTSDLYAVTHTPMYVTDFGRLGRTSAESGWLGSLGLSRLLINDLDLAGEFAIADLLTQEKPDVGTLIITAALSTIFDQLGFIPAPTFRDEGYRKAEAPDDYLLFHTYHSTFVYGLLCCVLVTLQVQDISLKTIVSVAHPQLPAEWNGHRLDIAELSDRVVHTVEAWYGVATERGVDVDQNQLVRAVLDAYLLDAVIADRTDELVSLLGMAKVAGPSPVDLAIRELFAVRAWLGGNEVFSTWLPSAK